MRGDEPPVVSQAFRTVAPAAYAELDVRDRTRTIGTER